MYNYMYVPIVTKDPFSIWLQIEFTAHCQNFETEW